MRLLPVWRACRTTLEKSRRKRERRGYGGRRWRESSRGTVVFFVLEGKRHLQCGLGALDCLVSPGWSRGQRRRVHDRLRDLRAVTAPATSGDPKQRTWTREERKTEVRRSNRATGEGSKNQAERPLTAQAAAARLFMLGYIRRLQEACFSGGHAGLGCRAKQQQ